MTDRHPNQAVMIMWSTSVSISTPSWLFPTFGYNLANYLDCPKKWNTVNQRKSGPMAESGRHFWNIITCVISATSWSASIWNRSISQYAQRVSLRRWCCTLVLNGAERKSTGDHINIKQWPSIWKVEAILHMGFSGFRIYFSGFQGTGGLYQE